MALTINILILIISAFVLAKSGTLLVRSLSKLARFLKVSEYMIAFVLVAFATSVPELFVGIVSALNKTPEISLGNVIGSNIADVTLVMGIIALLGRYTKIQNKFIFKDLFYMFLIALVPILLMLDNLLSRLDGFILLIIFFLYMYKMIHKNKSVERINNVHYTEVFKNFGIFFLSILLLLGSAEFLVRSAKEISIELNLPILLIGLFVVAIGTSLPELVYGSRAVLLKHKEQALGNIMGSIVANSTAVLGITAIITPIAFNFSLFLISGSFMIFALFIFMIFIRSGSAITWREGVALLMLYILFIIVQFYIQGLPTVQ
jgi:cation:H+ antiporter|tara:strand:- start:17157 stop:18110 length:954 start_codon:yes stop_codon:yes gene_type:complete